MAQTLRGWPGVIGTGASGVYSGYKLHLQPLLEQ